MSGFNKSRVKRAKKTNRVKAKKPKRKTCKRKSCKPMNKDRTRRAMKILWKRLK